MSTIVAIANQKGGVGKTTTCVNLAKNLAAANKRVLVIDLDPQGNGLTNLLAKELISDASYNDDNPASCWGMFKSATKPQPYDAGNGLYVVATSNQIERIDMDEIYNFQDSVELIEPDVDFILLDCPPSSRVIQHAALLTSDYLLVVTHAEPQSVNAVATIMNTMRKTQRSNPNLKVAGIVMNLLEKPATNTQKHNANELKQTYGDLIFENNLFKTVKVTEAVSQGQSLNEYMPGHAEKFGFNAFINEFITRVEGKENE
ncbi:sporulation initiation inhibitor Soj [Vibrio sp. MACH09]|uniref:ParA family protein n=1 Tax=Vibrio sp. MACH09 TaxID=3025122 RepID=UPI0027922AD1|nr:ParA family protein [Vibrio sp. MACH09]GLO64151.1 sporulation initiation inhibitor Soj [Vibrio sp. MACH09]